MYKSFPLALTLSCVICVTVTADENPETSKIDFGDNTSSTLTTLAWKALEAKEYGDVLVITKRCIKTYEKEAITMQKSLSAPVPTSDEDAVAEKWALNDVGTCYFIMGQALEKQDKTDDAISAYQMLSKKVSFAQCWDPQGWYWKPVDAAKKRIKVLEFEKLEKEDNKE